MAFSTKYLEALDYLQNLSDRDFIETHFKIIDKDRRERPFIFNPVQTTLESDWADWNTVLKYRKPGVSVLVQAKFLARCLRKKNRNCVVLSYDRDATQRMLERTDWILNNLPKFMDFHLERESKNEFKVSETNSKLFIGVAGSKAFGRGDDITDLHISEYAFWEDTSIITGLMEALTNDSFVVVESTANGGGNDFAKLYRKGRLGAGKWRSHFFPWWIDGGLSVPITDKFIHTEDEKELKTRYPSITDEQLNWRRRKIADMIEPELFPQEYPSNDEEAFLILGDCIFNKRSLANYDKFVSYPSRSGYLSAVTIQG